MAKLKLQATLNNNGSITAKWNKVPGAVRYKAYMYPVGKSYMIYNQNNLKVTSYTSQTNLEANQQYQIVVAAYDNSKELDSEGKKLLIRSDFYTSKPPAVPKNVKAVADVTSVTVSFDKVSNATGYDILFDGKTYSVTSTSKVFSGLDPQTSYTYAVRAKNAKYKSAYSATKTVTTLARKLTVPTNIKKSSTENKVVLIWKAVNEATSYDLMFDGTVYEVIGTSKIIKDLSANKNYTFKIRSKNADGVSAYSAIQTVKTTPLAPNVRNATTTESSMTISWDAVAGATGYEVYVNGKRYTVTETYAVITGLSANKSYSYKVRTLNIDGESSYCVSKTVRTAPLPPSKTTIESAANSVTISWEEVEGAESYDVIFNDVTYRVTETSKTFNGLEPKTNYFYQIRCNHGDGSSSYSTLKKVTTLPTPPPMPTNVRATATENSVIIRWNVVSDAESYTICFNGVKYNNVKGISKAFKNLEPSTKYTYSVCAVNAGGSGAYSIEQAIQTKPIVPKTPTDVFAMEKANSVTIHVGIEKGVDSCDILFEGTLYNTTNMDFLISGLKPNTEYTYQVRARNEVGVSEYSEIRKIRTLLETPKNIRIRAKSKEIIIAFDAVEGATSYDVAFDNRPYRVTEPYIKFDNLLPETKHTFFVHAENEYVESFNCEEKTIITLPPGPEVPFDVEATATMNMVMVSFSPVEEATDYDVNFDDEIYRVTDDGDVSGPVSKLMMESGLWEDNRQIVAFTTSSVPAVAAATDVELAIPYREKAISQIVEGRIYVAFVGLQPNTEHTYCARANNEEGSSRYSEQKTIYTEMASGDGWESGEEENSYPSGKTYYTGADPVNALTGAFLWNYTWLEERGKDKLQFTTMYDSRSNLPADVLGEKWTHSFQYLLRVEDTYAYFSTPYGGVIPFCKNAETNTFEVANGMKTTYRMEKNADSSYSVKESDGSEYIFDGNCGLNRIVKNGLVKYRFATDAEGRIVSIEGRGGARLTIAYENDRIICVTDNQGNKVEFVYENGCLIAVLNSENREMKFSYDDAFNLLKISDFTGETYLENKYDAYGRVREQYTAGRGLSQVSYKEKERVTVFTDELGNNTKYTYDENGNMVKTERAGNCMENSYNEYGQLIGQVDTLGRVTKMEYDSKGRMNRVIHPDGTEEQVEYNERNMPVKVVKRDGAINRYYYDGNNNLLEIQDERGESVTYSYDEKDNLVSFTDRQGNVWNCIYDENNHIRQVTDPEGRVCQYEHDAIGRLTRYTSAEGRSISYQYLTTGELQSMQDADGVLLYEYDADGNRIGVTDRMGHKQRLEYNAMGQVSLVTDFLGNEYRFEYDAKGNLVKEFDPLGNTVSYAYDVMGNRTALTDANGNVTASFFDAANQLTEVRDAAGGTVKYAYDTMGRVTAVTNPLEQQTTYAYDTAGRVTCVTDALGNSVSYTYDGAGNLLTKTDEEGVVTTYAYDAENQLIEVRSEAGNVGFIYDSLGRVIQVTDTDGYTEKTTYDADGNLTADWDKDGNKTTYSYNAAGRLVQVTAADGTKTKYAYDKNGNCTQVTDAQDNVYSYEYDGNNRLVKTMNPLKQQTTYVYDAVGKLVSITDARGGVTAFAYDNNGNLIRETNPLGGEKTYFYDNLNRLTQVVDEAGYKQSYTYDAAGNVVFYKDANENNWIYEYDALNRVKRVEGQNGGALQLDYTRNGKIAKVTDQEGAETNYFYDACGRMTEMCDALGHSMKFTYDSKGRILTQTDANGNRTEYGYSPKGNLLLMKDSEDNTTTYTYDVLGQLMSETNPLGHTVTYKRDSLGRVTSIIDGAGEETTITYDGLGQIASVTDVNGGITQYFYDACGNLKQMVDALGNTIEYEYDAMNNRMKECLSTSEEQTCVTLYQYDKRGCMVRRIDPMSEEKNYTYDGNGNPVSIVDEEKQETRVWYDLNNQPAKVCYGDGKEVTFRYNKRGELVEMTDWNGMVSVERDPLGRVKRVTDSFGHVTGYSYDAVGNRTEIGYPDGSLVKYTFDKNNRLTEITDAEGQKTAYGYDPAGNVLSIIQPESTASFTYNAKRKPIQASYCFSNGTVMENQFAYDLMGRITGLERTGTREELTGSAAYTYDALGRLLSYREGQNTENYVYDALGNRTAKTVNGVETATYQYNSMNQLIAMMEDGISYSFAYDKRGNLTEEKKGDNLVRSFAYDATNRMVLGKNMMTGETTEYGYNGLLARIKNVQNRVKEGTPYLKETAYVVDYLSGYKNDLMGYEKGAGATRTVYGKGYDCVSKMFLPEGATAGEKTHYQTDIYGSPLFTVLEGTGAPVYTGRTVWGNPGSLQEVLGLPFTTYSHDEVIDRYFAQARFYDSSLGRMVAKDPVKSGLNPYTYCNNDPVNFIDPSGEIVVSHLLKSFGAGLFDGVCEFAESAVTQYRSGEDVDWLEAFGNGARGFVKGSAEEFFLGKGTRRVVTAATDFFAGAGGTLAKQLISGDDIDFVDALHQGVLNTVEGQVFGKGAVSGTLDAIKRGARAGAATSIVDNAFGALEKKKSGVSAGTGLLGAALNSEVSRATSRNPKLACGSANPFRDGLRFQTSSGSRQLYGEATSRTGSGFSLEDTIKDVVSDTIFGGLGGAAQYVGGGFFEKIGNSVFGKKNRRKSGSEGGSKIDVNSGLGYDAGDTPVRIDGEWSINDMKQALLGHPPRGLGSPDIHHGGQMPGAAKHEIIPSEHRNNSALHPNTYNQGVTPEMRVSDRQLHWWYRAREQSADQLLPDWIYDD